jgi:tight adherence protein C
MDLLALLASAIGTGLVVFLILDVFFSEEQRVRRRLESLGTYGSGAITEAQPLASPFRDRILVPAAGALARGLGAIAPQDYLRRLRGRLVTAGRLSRTAAERVLVVKLGLTIAGVVLATLFATATGASGLRTVVYAVVVALLLSYLPDIYVRSQAESRQRRIARELPDMLDMLTISVEAGLGFDQAVSKYVQNASGPLAKEYGMTLREIQAGKSRRDALRTLGDRTGVSELRAFIMAIVQADVFGVSVSDVLRTQSHEMRLKRRQRAQEMAQKAPAKMVFPLILCILPATLIVVMGPAVVGISRVLFGM